MRWTCPARTARTLPAFTSSLCTSSQLFPGVPLPPEGMVQEDEDVLERLHLLERLAQPGHLPRAQPLLLGVAEVALPAVGMALVREEDEEADLLVLEPVPEGAEVLLVVELVLELRLLLRRLVVAAPVHVVVPGHREPGHPEPVHGGAELLHLPHPGLGLVVAVDEVADRHHEVGVEQVRIVHRLGEDLDALDGPAGAVAEDDEVEDVIPLGKRQQDRRRDGRCGSPRRPGSRSRGDRRGRPGSRLRVGPSCLEGQSFSWPRILGGGDWRGKRTQRPGPA